MNIVDQYIKDNNVKFVETFNQLGTDGEIQATKVFQLFQSIFDSNKIAFFKNSKNYFSNDENAQQTQSLIEQYYKTTPQGQESKFYMYRIKFSIGQLMQIIKFWLSKDTSVTVVIPTKQNKSMLSKNKKPHNQKIKVESMNQNSLNNQKEQSKNMQIDDDSDQQANDFLPQENNLPEILEKYQQQISKYEDKLKTSPLNEQEIKTYQSKIQQLKSKMQFINQKMERRNNKKKQITQLDDSQIMNSGQHKKTKSQTDRDRQSQSVSPKKSSRSPQKMQNTLKSIFQFHSKNNSYTGVKNSFQRILRESSRITYQKLVHLLKQFKIFPNKVKDQKKLHHIYVRNTQTTRDLSFQGFLKFLDSMSQIIIQGGPQVNKPEQIRNRIIQQKKKNKLLHNPFHSLEKQDFRIDKSSLRYEFKLMPLNGKNFDQVHDQLRQRRQFKVSQKQEVQKQKLQRHIRHIKKLQSIDPFHPLVEKNRHLIEEKNVIELEPIASMDNIERYRDSSFNVKELFGIEGAQDDIFGKISSKGHNDESPQNRRVRQVEKLEIDKMRNLMNGIIDRSNQKLQKLGLSPGKRRNHNLSSLM